MSTKITFDESIKQRFLNGNPILPGRTAEKDEYYGRTITTKGKTKYYNTYFSEPFGSEILEMLDDEVRNCYKDGKGGELKSKFFSVASSSRFAVANFTHNDSGTIKFINKYAGEVIKAISFEKDLPIKNISGTPPQMDVWIKTSHDVFFEVKCHEIFDEYEHANIKLSTQYSKNTIFNEIIEHYAIDLSTREQIYVKNGTPHYYYLFNRNMFKVFTKTSHFDLKQFICHLMGILSYKENNSVVEFNYLFYKHDDKQFDNVYAELEEEISVIYESFMWLFNKYNLKFSYVYNDKFTTLDKHLHTFCTPS